MVENEVQVGVRRTNLSARSGIDGIDKLIESALNLYTLQKRVAYLIAFVDWFRCCEVRKKDFIKPVLTAAYLEKTLLIIVKLVQNKVYGDVICSMQGKFADALGEVIKQCDVTASPTQQNRLKELRSLKKYRLCVDEEGRLRFEGRLSKSPKIPWEAKHPLLLPFKHHLTRLVVLFCHYRDCHCGVQHTLMSTRLKFWIVNGNAAVRRYVRNCGLCAIERAMLIRQLMSDLLLARHAAHKKPFFYSGVDYLGPLNFAEVRSNKKAWGLLFACMASWAIYVGLETSLLLDDFLLAFTEFTDMDRSIRFIHIMEARSRPGQKAP